MFYFVLPETSRATKCTCEKLQVYEASFLDFFSAARMLVGGGSVGAIVDDIFLGSPGERTAFSCIPTLSVSLRFKISVISWGM